MKHRHNEISTFRKGYVHSFVDSSFASHDSHPPIIHRTDPVYPNPNRLVTIHLFLFQTDSAPKPKDGKHPLCIQPERIQ